MTSLEIIEKVKALELPKKEYVILGGGALAVRGIRDTKDIDILVTSRLFEALSKIYPSDPLYEGKWNRSRLKANGIEIYPDLYLENGNRYFDVTKVISNAEVVHGIPLQPLDNLIICKQDSGRDKDLQDVELIQKYLVSK